MAIVKPFRGLRPPKNLVEKVSCLPYDVMNSEEAAQMAEGKKESLLHVTRAEIDLPKGTDLHSEIVYNKAVENFAKMQKEGWLVEDEKPKFYIYAQTMDGRRLKTTSTALSRSTSLPVSKRKKTVWFSPVTSTLTSNQYSSHTRQFPKLTL